VSKAVAIIDSGGANIASLLYAFERLGESAELTVDARRIRAAKRVVLPGVGAARNAMQRLQQHELVETIRGLSQPVLGICLGMQLLTDASEEDAVDCLQIVPGTAKRLPVLPDFPVPNMGWCPVRLMAAHPVLAGIDDGAWFYFLHSYAVPLGEHCLAAARHGTEFAAIVAQDNFIAAQFHPERSSAAGAALLRNFLAWAP
jgi:imidazole glycerol-phosphate synthase subunit HisH